MIDSNITERRDEARFLKRTVFFLASVATISAVILLVSGNAGHRSIRSGRGDTSLFSRGLTFKGDDSRDGDDGDEPDDEDRPVETEEPFDSTKKYLKIKRDAYGVAEKVKGMFDPYLYVQLVTDGSEHVKFDLTEGTSYTYDIVGSSPFEGDGLSLSGEINTSSESQFDSTIIFFFKQIAQASDVQLQSACDAGYLYSRKRDVSCCTANQLSSMDLTCFEGKREANPPCFEAPDTTPTSGMKLSKVKFIVAPSLVSYGWTQEDTENEIEKANRLIISSNLGSSAQLRYVFHSQETASSDLGTDAVSLHTEMGTLASEDAGKGGFDVLMYLFRDTEPDNGIGGRAQTGHCLSNPSTAVANIYWSDTTYHELMHLVGADHDSLCNDGYIVNNDIDSGVSPCNVARLKSTIPTYSCLEVAA